MKICEIFQDTRLEDLKICVKNSAHEMYSRIKISAQAFFILNHSNFQEFKGFKLSRLQNLEKNFGTNNKGTFQSWDHPFQEDHLILGGPRGWIEGQRKQLGDADFDTQIDAIRIGRNRNEMKVLISDLYKFNVRISN